MGVTETFQELIDKSFLLPFPYLPFLPFFLSLFTIYDEQVTKNMIGKMQLLTWETFSNLLVQH